jgi:acyl carrier protein
MVRGLNMNRDIAVAVRRVVHQQLHVDEARITPWSSLTKDLGADSLRLIELTLALEDEFGVEINDDDAESIRTVQDAIRFIETRVKEGGSAGASAS